MGLCGRRREAWREGRKEESWGGSVPEGRREGGEERRGLGRECAKRHAGRRKGEILGGFVPEGWAGAWLALVTSKAGTTGEPNLAVLVLLGDPRA